MMPKGVESRKSPSSGKVQDTENQHVGVQRLTQSHLNPPVLCLCCLLPEPPVTWGPQCPAQRVPIRSAMDLLIGSVMERRKCLSLVSHSWTPSLLFLSS